VKKFEGAALLSTERVFRKKIHLGDSIGMLITFLLVDQSSPTFFAQ